MCRYPLLDILLLVPALTGLTYTDHTAPHCAITVGIEQIASQCHWWQVTSKPPVWLLEQPWCMQEFPVYRERMPLQLLAYLRLSRLTDPALLAKV